MNGKATLLGFTMKFERLTPVGVVVLGILSTLATVLVGTLLLWAGSAVLASQVDTFSVPALGFWESFWVTTVAVLLGWFYRSAITN